MPDLDTSLRELRDELRGRLTRPDLSQVAGRAQQQVVRRRMQLGAIVAVVLVSVAVPVMRMVPSGSHPPAQPPDPPPPYVVDFADADHGYAFRQDCEEMNGPCTFSMRATTDGGATWQPVELPDGDEPYGRGGIAVLGPKEVWFSRAKSGLRGVPEQFVTDDGGGTWRGHQPKLQESPVVISPEGQLSPICIGSADIPCELGVGVRDPGGLSPVLTQPPLVNPAPGRTATEGGRYWATGQVENTGQWAVAVTSDDGRTWATSVLDLRGAPSDRVEGAWSLAERGPDMYLTVVGNAGVGPLELLAVFHSTDKGVTWTRTWQSTEKHELQAVTGDAVVTADGQLLVYSPVVGTVTSRDGGRTFTTASHQLPGPVTWTRAGYLATGPNNTFELSRNGLTWQRFEVR
jgi:hypothetical protein